MWHQRGQAPRGRRGGLPAVSDSTGGALDLARYTEQKLRFFERDATARYLSTQIAAPEPDAPRGAPRGSFSWVDRELRLEPPERFLLSLAILTGFDSAAGSVVATCLNDSAATQPTLALAQRLWDEPVEILTVAESGHRLLLHGLLEAGEPRSGRETVVDWRAPLVAPALVVRQLLFPALGAPAPLRPLDPHGAGGKARLAPAGAAGERRRAGRGAARRRARRGGRDGRSRATRGRIRRDA